MKPFEPFDPLSKSAVGKIVMNKTLIDKIPDHAFKDAPLASTSLDGWVAHLDPKTGELLSFQIVKATNPKRPKRSDCLHCGGTGLIETFRVVGEHEYPNGPIPCDCIEDTP